MSRGLSAHSHICRNTPPWILKRLGAFNPALIAVSHLAPSHSITAACFVIC